MKRITLCIWLIFFSLSLSAQQNVDALLSAMKKAKPFDTAYLKNRKPNSNHPSWINDCISGDCNNGYGIYMTNERGFDITRQYEGIFKNGDLDGISVMTTGKGIMEAGTQSPNGMHGNIITFKYGLFNLDNMEGNGYTLQEVMQFQSKVFAAKFPCKCLSAVTYQEDYGTPRHAGTTIMGHFYENLGKEYYLSRTVNGLQNFSRHDIFIRSIAKGENKTTGKTEYYDNSFILGDYDKFEGKLKTNFINTTTNDGFDDTHVIYIGQYAENKEDVAACATQKVSSSEASQTSTKAISSESSSTTVSAKKIGSNTYEIDSYTTTTDITVAKGDKITVSASGSISFGIWAGSGGPDGIAGFVSYSKIQSLAHGSLLMRTGNGSWIGTGTEKSMTVTNQGKLQFMVNDADPGNNSGSFQVVIKITKAK